MTKKKKTVKPILTKAEYKANHEAELTRLRRDLTEAHLRPAAIAALLAQSIAKMNLAMADALKVYLDAVKEARDARRERAR